MRRGAVRLLIGLFLLCVPLGIGVAQEHVDWAQGAIEYLALTSGLGMRWEPSPAEAGQFASALGKPLDGFRLNGAPFAQGGVALVTSEALAWTILAELEWARRLSIQGSPQTLLFIYLASHQVSFAKNGMLDPDRGLYYPGWREGAILEGDPEPRDQMLMLWALAAYSQLGELLSTGETDAELFRKFVSPLADRLFQAIQKEREVAPAWWHLTRSEEELWFQALGEYLDITLSATLRNEARPEWQEVRSKLQGALELDGLRIDPGIVRYSLVELADLLGRLDSQRVLADKAEQEGLRTQFEHVMNAPPVQVLLEQSPLWPSSVAYDPAAKKWQVSDATFQTAPAMSLAFRALRLDQGLALTGMSQIPSPVEGLTTRLDALRLKVAAFSQSSIPAMPISLHTGSPPQPSTGLELLLLVASLILSLELIMLAGWRQRT